MVLKACSDTSIPLTRLARMVASEPSLAMELLRVANSGFYGSRAVRSAQQAVVLLGARAVRNYAVAHVLRVASEGLSLRYFDLDQFWQDSLRRATISLILGRRAGCEDPWEAFTVGLIQEAGTPMLVAMYPEFARELTEAQELPGPARRTMENSLLGTDHALLLARVGGSWGLPDDLVDAIRHHHQGPPPGVSRRAAQLTRVARVADAVADLMALPENTDVLMRAQTLLEELPGRQKTSIDTLVALTEDELPNLAIKHKMPVDSRPPVAAVVAQAVASMVKITTHYEHVTQEMEELLQERQRLTRMLEVSNSRLRRLATTDELTGATNRRFFMSCLRQTLAETGHTRRPVSVLMIDLDKFKRINDSYGHATGDDVLSAAAARLNRVLRPSDMLGRLGGEEFGVLLPNTDDTEAMNIAEMCRRELSGTPIEARGGIKLTVTGSIGVATNRGRIEPDALLAAADHAMYDAKSAGGDQLKWAEAVS